MNIRVKRLIARGDTDGLRVAVTRRPRLARARIYWGLPPCKTEPLHFLSDGFFNGLWNHGQEGELAVVLIQGGAPVDGLPDSGESPLHGAASLGCVHVAEVLVKSGANLESIASYPGIPHGTPLDFAVHFGMVDVVDLLVRSGAKIGSARMAAGAGLLDEFKKLLPNPENEQMNADIIRCAVVCDRIEIVNFFLARGLDVNQEIDGGTPLHWAAWEAKPTMVEFLLSQGADIEQRDSVYDLTPLGWVQHRLKGRGRKLGYDHVVKALDDWSNG